jgi:hypothetical protein
MTEGELSYYREPGPLTRVPQPHAQLLAGLPTDVAGLAPG